MRTVITPAIEKLIPSTLSTVATPHLPIASFDFDVQGLIQSISDTKYPESPCEQLSKHLIRCEQKLDRNMLSHSYTYHFATQSVKCVHFEPVSLTQMTNLDSNMRIDQKAKTPQAYFSGQVSIKEDAVTGVSPLGNRQSFELPK